MTERNDRLNEIVGSLASVQDKDLASLSTTPAARALFDEIVATPRSEHTRRASRFSRVRFAPVRVGVAAAGVILLVVGLLVGRQVVRAPEAVAFSTEGDYIVARIVDPAATRQELEAAFAQHGLDVRAILVPASPSLVGTVGAMYPEGASATSNVELLYEQGVCFTQGGGFQCPVGLKIPTDFVGQVTIEIGRTARSGETYEIATDAFAPGEILHCTGVRGKTVSEALPVLASREVRATWRATEEGDAVQGIDPATIADAYVVDALPRGDGEVWIWVSPERPTFDPAITAMLDRGC